MRKKRRSLKSGGVPLWGTKDYYSRLIMAVHPKTDEEFLSEPVVILLDRKNELDDLESCC